jgi:hypothetical protein
MTSEAPERILVDTNHEDFGVSVAYRQAAPHSIEEFALTEYIRADLCGPSPVADECYFQGTFQVNDHFKRTADEPREAAEHPLEWDLPVAKEQEAVEALRKADWALQPFSDCVIDPSGCEPQVLETKSALSDQRFFDARNAYRAVRAALRALNRGPRETEITDEMVERAKVALNETWRTAPIYMDATEIARAVLSAALSKETKP